jgi:hypothetical protein
MKLLKLKVLCMKTIGGGAYKRRQRAGHGGPSKNPEIGNLSIFRILTSNLFSKVLY